MRRGEECFRDYLRGISEKQQRSSRLTAWFLTPPNYFAQVSGQRNPPQAP